MTIASIAWTPKQVEWQDTVVSTLAPSLLICYNMTMIDDFGNIIDHLTDNARSSLRHAESIARTQGSPYIGTEHVLLGVMAAEGSVGAQMLADARITLDRAKSVLNLTPRTLTVGGSVKGLSETAKLAIRMGWDVASEFHQDFCGTEHILYSILTQRNARATVLLRDMGVNVDELIASIEEYLNRQNNDHFESLSGNKTNRKPAKQPALGAYGNDITAQAKKGSLDPVIGRDDAIKRVMTILCRRTKNNPVLIGEPGVGKTAIVEGLAQRIAKGDTPVQLQDKRIVQIDIASLVAGTKYRGEFEERLKKLIDEVSRDNSVILFVDELHLVVGAGSAEGSLDVANILKPALARGKLRLIGATTTTEFRKHIEKDSALERRFQQVKVEEPAIKDVIAIVKGLRRPYEEHHNVTVSDDVIEDLVYMADRYISERHMPDKAIDVLDEAAALIALRRSKTPSKTYQLEQELNRLEEQMEEAATQGDYERAALYKTRSSRVRQTLDELKAAGTDTPKVTSDDTAEAISVMTGIPMKQIRRSEAAMLKKLETHLAKHIIGQEEAVKNVARAIRRSRAGVAHPKRPIGSFIFMGPTGVGKTELARVLAREVFGSEKALIKIDMSEFRERHTTSRLVGAPAGYVGYDDEGQLTDKIRRQPYSVVLFDEIEKAHPEVFHLLLQMLEDGTLTDSKGRHVSFANTIVILTSNVGAQEMQKEAQLGFDVTSKKGRGQLDELHARNRSAALKVLESIMRPELINRFDSLIVFRALTKKEVGRICELLVADINSRLIRKGLSLLLTPAAKKVVIEKGFTTKYGARQLRRTLQDDVEHAVAEGIIDGRFKKGMALEVGAVRGTLDIRVLDEAA